MALRFSTRHRWPARFIFTPPSGNSYPSFSLVPTLHIPADVRVGGALVWLEELSGSKVGRGQLKARVDDGGVGWTVHFKDTGGVPNPHMRFRISCVTPTLLSNALIVQCGVQSTLCNPLPPP